MGDNLHDLNRKELKELCSQNNIRTAGVKHEDLVRLLRNKLHPSTPQTPRSTKARSPKMQPPGKEDVESFKTPGKVAGKGRNLRGPSLQREDITPLQRKTSSLSRKPLLTKSNTINTRRTTPPTTAKTSGLDQDSHENFVRRLCQINGMSPLSRRSAEAPGQLQTASKLNSNNPSFLRRESKDGTPSPTLTLALSNENESIPSPDGVASDDAGSDASRRVSEIATDAGPDTMSDFSDADEFRSVSSEPISKLPSSSIISKRNLSKMSQSGLSFFTAENNWGSERSRSDLDNGFSVDSRSDHHMNELIFPDFAEGSNFLVGDAEGLDLHFLHAGAADPEVIVNGKHDAVDDGKDLVDDQVKNVQNVMDSPMAMHYVTYSRGTEMNPEECDIEAKRVLIGSNQGENCDANETSVEEDDKQRDFGAEDGAELKELGRINVDGFRNQNHGAGVIESTQSCCGITNSELVDRMSKGMEDTDGIHSQLPCFESNSPRFDSKDYSIAKKLVFEPAAAQLQQSQSNGSNSLNGEQEGPAATNIEEKDSALDSKPGSRDLDEPTSNNQAETVFETANTSRDSDHGECRLGDQIAEQDGSNEAEQDGNNEAKQDVNNKAEQDGSNEAEQDGNNEAKQDGSNEAEQDGNNEAKQDGNNEAEQDGNNEAEQDGNNEAEQDGNNEAKQDGNNEAEQDGNNEAEQDGNNEAQQDVNNEAEQDGNNEAKQDVNNEAEQDGNNEADQEGDKSSEDKLVSQETEAQVSSTLERVVSQPQLDTPSVAPTKDDHPSGNASPAPDQSSPPADEEEKGLDVKSRDEECAGTSTTTDYNKEEHEKETTQVKLSFPLSIILWCSQWCSPASRNRNPCPRS